MIAQSRLVSNTICQSTKFDRLGRKYGAAAQVFYLLWLTQTDPKGYVSTDPAEAKRRVYPRRPKTNLRTVQRFIDATIAVGLIIPCDDGRPFARFYRFDDFNKLKYGKSLVDDGGVMDQESDDDAPIIEPCTGGHPPMTAASYPYDPAIIGSKNSVKQGKSGPDVNVSTDVSTDVRRNDPIPTYKQEQKRRQPPAPLPAKVLGTCLKCGAPLGEHDGAALCSGCDDYQGSCSCVTKPATANPAPKRKLGFDPYAVAPFDGWTAEQIQTVVTYHWEHGESDFWRTKTRSKEWFKKHFATMAEQMPTDWHPPTANAVQREAIREVADPACTVCHGNGIDASRPANLCACARFVTAEGKHVSYYEFACYRHGKAKVDSLRPAAIGQFRKMGLPV